MSMLEWLTLPFYDFYGFRSVAVNIVYKLQFFTFILIGTTLTTVLHYRADCDSPVVN